MISECLDAPLIFHSLTCLTPQGEIPYPSSDEAGMRGVFLTGFILSNPDNCCWWHLHGWLQTLVMGNEN